MTKHERLMVPVTAVAKSIKVLLGVPLVPPVRVAPGVQVVPPVQMVPRVQGGSR